jgi:hypothetical protein
MKEIKTIKRNKGKDVDQNMIKGKDDKSKSRNTNGHTARRKRERRTQKGQRTQKE